MRKKLGLNYRDIEKLVSKIDDLEEVVFGYSEETENEDFEEILRQVLKIPPEIDIDDFENFVLDITASKEHIHTLVNQAKRLQCDWVIIYSKSMDKIAEQFYLSIDGLIMKKSSNGLFYPTNDGCVPRDDCEKHCRAEMEFCTVSKVYLEAQEELSKRKR